VVDAILEQIVSVPGTMIAVGSRFLILAPNLQATANVSLHPCVSCISLSIHRCSKPHRTGAKSLFQNCFTGDRHDNREPQLAYRCTKLPSQCLQCEG
jgi:hypothetical protein